MKNIKNTEFYIVLNYLNTLQDGVYKYIALDEICENNKDKLKTRSSKETIKETIKELNAEGYVWESKDGKVKINIRGRYFISKISEESENANTLLEYSKRMHSLTWGIVILTAILFVCSIIQVVIILK